MNLRGLTVVPLLLALAVHADAVDSNIEFNSDLPPMPSQINGVELQSITGWFANLYPWRYIPSMATVYPVARLWTPKGYQSPAARSEERRVGKSVDLGGRRI